MTKQEALMSSRRMSLKSDREELVRSMRSLSSMLTREASLLAADSEREPPCRGIVQHEGRDIDALCTAIYERTDALKLAEQLLQE